MPLLALPHLDGAFDAPAAEAPIEAESLYIPTEPLEIRVHCPAWRPNAQTASAETGAAPEASFKSTSFRVLAARAYHEAKEEEATYRKEGSQLKNQLYEEQKPYRDDPELVQEFMTGSAGERIAALRLFRPTKEAIALTRQKREDAHRRALAAIGLAYDHAKPQ